MYGFVGFRSNLIGFAIPEDMEWIGKMATSFGFYLTCFILEMIERQTQQKLKIAIMFWRDIF